MKSIFTLSICFFVSLSLFSQKLVSYEPLSPFQAGIINAFVSGAKAIYDVETYKVSYNTTDAVGTEHIASGLVCIPISTSSLTFPLGCWQHGTVSDRDDVPSKLAGGTTLPVAFSTYGYVVCAPDFVGLGDSPGTHPYVHAASEASAGVDLMLATREMIAEIDRVDLNDQVFISGYSQGGHAAMALHRELELNQSDRFTVTACAPMSGPYSISEKMIDFTLGDKEYETVAYLAWLTLGYQTAYPDLLAGIELEDVFKPEYIEDIRAFEAEEIPLFDNDMDITNDLNSRMIATLVNTVGSVTPKNTLKDDILEAILNDPTHPFSQALADNDTYDWSPKAPTNLYYCEGDDQVTFENAILAQEVMQANGSTVVTAIRKDTDSVLLDHGGCVVPSSLDALDFFGTFASVTSSTKEQKLYENVSVYLHDNQLNIDLSGSELTDVDMELYDMYGRLLIKDRLQLDYSQYDLTDLHSGSYIVRVTSARRIVNTTKLVKN